jgi:hypothetical protein
VTAREAAEHAKVTQATIRSWVRKGLLPKDFTLEDLELHLARGGERVGRPRGPAKVLPITDPAMLDALMAAQKAVHATWAVYATAVAEYAALQRATTRKVKI